MSSEQAALKMGGRKMILTGRKRWSHHGLWSRRCIAFVMIFCSLVAVACSGYAKSNPDRLIVSREQLALLPMHGGGGEGGWCLSRVSDINTCKTYREPAFEGPFQGQIIVEHWSGSGGTGEPDVEEALVLTTSEVMAISLEGRVPVMTHASPLLPDHMRGVIIELRGGSGVFPLRSHLVALNSKGDPIPQSRVPGPPLEFNVPSEDWNQIKRQPRGVCHLQPSLPGLFQGGSVMSRVVPHPDVRGREFVVCLNVNYVIKNWPVEVDVFLDAAHPGSTPAPLPAMRPLAKHPGVFQGPGAGGEWVARRIPGAWLVVAKGENLKQRIIVLEHLRGAIRV